MTRKAWRVANPGRRSKLIVLKLHWNGSSTILSTPVKHYLLTNAPDKIPFISTGDFKWALYELFRRTNKKETWILRHPQQEQEIVYLREVFDITQDAYTMILMEPARIERQVQV